MDLVPYTITKGKNGDAWVKAGGEEYSPSQVSAFILQKMKETAESYSWRDRDAGRYHRARLFSTMAQRQATNDARPEFAGLKCCRQIIQRTAPAAALWPNGMDKGRGERIAVYDLGGGTFDVSILEIGDGVFEVKSTNGDTFLAVRISTMPLSNILPMPSRRTEGHGS